MAVHAGNLTIADIAAISGNSPVDPEAIIRRHYLASEAVANAWNRLEP
ncbi:MAG: hypothetical protein RIC18_06925 [Hoeflea sp.]